MTDNITMNENSDRDNCGQDNCDEGNYDRLACRLEDDTRVVVVGLGGIGGALLQPLALFLHSYRVAARLVLVDGDEFEPRNSERQIFQSLGNKAEVKAAETARLIGDSAVTVVPVADYIKKYA